MPPRRARNPSLLPRQLHRLTPIRRLRPATTPFSPLLRLNRHGISPRCAFFSRRRHSLRVPVVIPTLLALASVCFRHTLRADRDGLGAGCVGFVVIGTLLAFPESGGGRCLSGDGGSWGAGFVVVEKLSSSSPPWKGLRALRLRLPVTSLAGVMFMSMARGSFLSRGLRVSGAAGADEGPVPTVVRAVGVDSGAGAVGLAALAALVGALEAVFGAAGFFLLAFFAFLSVIPSSLDPSSMASRPLAALVRLIVVRVLRD